MSSSLLQIKFNQTLGTGTVYSEPIKVDISEIATLQIVTEARGTALLQISNDEKNPTNWFDVSNAIQPHVNLDAPGGFWNISNLGCRFIRIKFNLHTGGAAEFIALLKDT